MNKPTKPYTLDAQDLLLMAWSDNMPTTAVINKLTQRGYIINAQAIEEFYEDMDQDYNAAIASNFDFPEKCDIH